VTEEMSGGLRHHSDEATGPESCGWIKRHRKKYRYYLEQTGASALRGSYAPGLQKQSSMYLDSADVVRDVEKLFPAKIRQNKIASGCRINVFLIFKTFCTPQIPAIWA
jgi:hypothetical protein